MRKFRWDREQSHIWLTASLYMVKYLRISSYIRKPFLICDFAPDPFLISIYTCMRKFVFSFFISLVKAKIEAMIATHLRFAIKHSHLSLFSFFPFWKKIPPFLYNYVHYYTLYFIGEEYVFPFCFPKIIKRDYEIRNAFSADN